jgi:hypothetical protein
LVNLSGWPVVRKPHVKYIYTDTHDGVKEETNFGPPSSPNHQFTSHHCVQASETN